MKRIVCVLMLIAGIKGTLFAQQAGNTPSFKKPFTLPDNYINRRFYLELHQGNEIQLGLKSIRDFNYIGDLDSLIRVCLRELAPFKDSLSNELTSKKIDYTIDASGQREVRISQTMPGSSSFLLQADGISALKMTQDTIHILAMVNAPVPSSGAGSGESPHWFEVNIIVNGIAELPRLMSADIKGKMDMLKRCLHEQNPKADWKWVAGKDRRLHLQQDMDIAEDHPDGGVALSGDLLEIIVCTNVQNYKSYFVPSFSLGAEVVFNSATDLLHRPSPFKYEIGLNWEPQFFFQNTQGKLQTYRNDFLTLTFNQSLKEKALPPIRSTFGFFFPGRFSIAYLINRNGPFYEKNTFRLGTGGVALFRDKFKLEPVIYFNNFFKGVTPGVRLQVAF